MKFIRKIAGDFGWISNEQFYSSYETIEADIRPDGFYNYQKIGDIPYGYFEIWCEGDTIYRLHAKPPRTFSKMKAVAALMKIGKWEICKQWIIDSGIYDLYLAAQDFREDNELFVLGLSSLKEQLGLTDELIEELLKAIEI